MNLNHRQKTMTHQDEKLLRIHRTGCWQTEQSVKSCSAYPLFKYCTLKVGLMRWLPADAQESQWDEEIGSPHPDQHRKTQTGEKKRCMGGEHSWDTKNEGDRLRSQRVPLIKNIIHPYGQWFWLLWWCCIDGDGWISGMKWHFECGSVRKEFTGTWEQSFRHSVGTIEVTGVRLCSCTNGYKKHVKMINMNHQSVQPCG